MRFFKTLILLLLLGRGALFAAPLPQKDLPKLELELGNRIVEVSIATTPEQHTIGLMHRTSLDANEGMLFVFDTPRPVAFWMKNTLIPLSIAYINHSGKILEIYDMEPLSEASVRSTFNSVLYALEMPQGWFQKNAVFPGMTIQGLPVK